LFIEHGHRLLATLAGLLTILLVVLLFRFEQRRWMRWVGIAALVGVLAQGVLGGLRVVLDERLLAMAHGSIGPLFFALTVAILVWTSATWLASTTDRPAAGLNGVAALGVVACVLVYVQMVLGAALRHMPVTASPHTFATALKAHLFLAAVVTLAVVIIGWRATRPMVPASVRRCGVGLVLIVAVQLGFGVLTWLSKYATPQWASDLIAPSGTATLADGWWQAHVVTAHQATGSLLLVLTLVTTMIVWRLAPSPTASESSPSSFAPTSASKRAATA
jgi:cytochrome c oxidase assembly protein subunit 15